MNLNDDYNVASRYRAIRKHLDSLGYRQALSLDALPLIEKLLADLIQTTDSLKHFKTVAQDHVEACSQLQLSIDPYKCDNARLVQECNQLHEDLIEAKETHQRQATELKKKIHNLESECNNLQLASSRNLKRIKELESESGQKSKRIQELLGKCCKPLISNVSLACKKRSCYPLRRPTLEAEPLPRAKSNSILPSLSKVEPRVVDLLAMADRKMNCLNHEVTGLKGELSMQVDNVYTLKAQLAIKEKEIQRLKKMLEGGRPNTAVSKDCCCKKNDQCNENNGCDRESDLHGISHKVSQTNDLRILQQVKSDLEQQLREALDKQHDAMSQAMKLAERNEELEKELRDIDHIALAVEADCNSAVKQNNKRVSQLQGKLESVMTQVHVLEGELMVERRSGQELRADLEAGRLENRNLQRKLESTLDEKKQMNDRINQLTVIEKSLNDEIQRLSRDNGYLVQEVARLDCANDTLKKQMHSSEIATNIKEDVRRIKEKGEKNDKNKGKMLTKKKPTVSRGQRRSLSPPVQEKQMETTRRKANARDDEVTRDSNVDATRNNSQKINSDNEAKINQLQSTIDQVQTDRDYYKNLYNTLREKCMKNSEVDNAELWGQVCELRRQLIDKEHTVQDLQREKKELSREKFELELRLQTSRSDRRNAYNPCSQCRPIDNCAYSTSMPSATGGSKASTVMLERLERERDTARADVDRLVEERDALRERLKLAVEAHKFEQQRLRKNLCEVENRLSQLEGERQDFLLAQGTQRATIDGFEDQLEDMREELRRTKQELTAQRTQYFQLRTLQDQADQALGDVQGQLSQSEAELYKVMDRNRLLEQQKLQLDNEMKALKQEINSIRSNVSRADQEKDQILMQLHEKNERIALLERELKIKEQEATTIEQQFQELQHKNQLSVDQGAEQERRLRNMQMEMEINQRQLASASTDRDNAAQENRRLQDDLAAVTCEIRTLQHELDASRAESYDLKRQLQTYVSEVRRAEELINRKENERTEMLNHFRSLSLEATMLENNNHSLESEAAEARGALQSAQDRSLDLERQLADRDCMIRGYEAQMTELTQTVASLETQIRQQMEQRQRAEADLNAVRDLCVKLDQQKETLVKELGDKDAMKAQYEAQLSRLKAEQNMVQDQINRDQVTVERLETLLDKARQESMDCETANQELQCEMSRLKQRMCELQKKLSSESAELRRYQNQAAEYSKQIGELRRQVTNERFDRARKEEEHRRKCQCGASGNATRRENIKIDSSQVNPQQKCLDCSSSNVRSCSLPRYGRIDKADEYRSRDGMRSEAQRTNRFGTNNVNKDISTSQTDREVGKIIDTTSYEQVGNSACGVLCVRATLEEDKDYKDIKVKISNTSACSNYEKEKNKPTMVKFCTPFVCKEPRQCRFSSANEFIGSEAENSDESREMREADKGEQENLSSRKNENLENYKIRSYRDKESREGMKFDSKLETKRALPCIDDETLPKAFSQDCENCNKNETMTSNDTLTNLRRLLDESVDANSRNDRNKCERSRSVPRGRSCGRDFDYVRSNLSFPVCVDYSEAALTAADLTRPEFVQTLTEIREYARNLERQLSVINNAMKTTNLNDAPSDIARIETYKKKVTRTHDKIDENKNSSLDTAQDDSSNELASSLGTAGISDKEKKWRKKNMKSKDSSSQSEIYRDAKVSSVKKWNKSSLDSAEIIRDEETQTVEAGKSGPIYLRQRDVLIATERSEIMKLSELNKPDDNRCFSENRIFPVESNEASSSGRQNILRNNSEFPEPVSTANEAIMVKPSKIHKLKKSVEPWRERKTPNEDPKNCTCKNDVTDKNLTPEQPKSASTQCSETREENHVQKIPSIEDPKKIACGNWRLSPGVSKSPTRLGASFSSMTGKNIELKRAKSVSTQSCETRTAAATSVADLHPATPPTTPTDIGIESGMRYDNQLSRFSLKRPSLSRSRSKNRKNDESPKGDKAVRSHSGGNSYKNTIFHDSVHSHTLRDNTHASDKSKNHGKMERIVVNRTGTISKPFASETMKNSAKLRSANVESSPKEPEVSSKSNTDGSSLQETPGTTKIYHHSRQPGTINNSLESRKLDKPAEKLFEPRTTGNEYSKSKKLITDHERRSSRSFSKSPSTRSRMSDSPQELSANIQTDSKRLATVKTGNNVIEKSSKNAATSNTISELHPRSRSDPRESRNYRGRKSR